MREDRNLRACRAPRRGLRRGNKGSSSGTLKSSVLFFLSGQPQNLKIRVDFARIFEFGPMITYYFEVLLLLHLRVEFERNFKNLNFG